MTDHEQFPEPTPEQAEEINNTIRYAMYSVFKAVRPMPDNRKKAVKEAEKFFASLEKSGVVVRGIYDVGGLRADADLLVWWHADTIEQLQDAYHGFLRTQLGQSFDAVWSNAGLHRAAEFNRGHVPAFLAGEEAGKYVCVYPFVRSYDWYILPEEDRRRMLREHGEAARDYKDVRANTISSFALGDYEWLLAFEAGELHRIVDLMRDLRAVDARRHVREEIPFFTGPQITIADLVEQLR
ncbi:hydrogen peroxide-dependent heme synthase [Yimella sp. cx-51]|uniref:hydrogen peroxide-dependent heme synthase n=1 Tax=Yimella sp. cx-51 TaxID=2770551 RepID=UPI00165E5F19|nr:hydrogen peroxide-dependent heme synthase [Yimella sp. cx-51]MBC9957675.1 chlorite dismutase family protein [Yimella sp. cx-51]MBD2758718.1 chlorite dismutase family protein [Yimella sp. cx-573]QTH36969.1 chlorite dismutase family protein [Yimella sp. cx-51]